ncbi:hypothetical protein BEL04_10815 [Mucilaginibacter sp. PPCGB 2223]|uniref:hypothetical protein n=1 Tax=Mucilaginibacter sp. PPCGB 2223 TaxID=1886027 RepID=UPI0008267F8C|nr:hypothetical protein [Mucilaginibacter sp. PPCGB 2223]OCX54707.1 hypothetical protein BEL04_10815 [Mucilaginibacter sp. PPCGB 2223]
MVDKEYRPRASAYYCPRCNIKFHAVIHRSWYIKLFFPNRPVRRFFCAQCLQKYYVRVNIPSAETYAEEAPGTSK